MTLEEAEKVLECIFSGRKKRYCGVCRPRDACKKVDEAFNSFYSSHPEVGEHAYKLLYGEKTEEAPKLPADEKLISDISKIFDITPEQFLDLEKEILKKRLKEIKLSADNPPK